MEVPFGKNGCKDQRLLRPPLMYDLQCDVLRLWVPVIIQDLSSPNILCFKKCKRNITESGFAVLRWQVHWV